MKLEILGMGCMKGVFVFFCLFEMKVIQSKEREGEYGNFGIYC